MQKSISLIILVTTVTSTYNETTKNRKVPPQNTMRTISKIIYNKESVRNILADFFTIKCRILRRKVEKKYIQSIYEPTF